ncbi:MAG: AraC family transcriptional regulator, partial [Burkholderiales bacterium]
MPATPPPVEMRDIGFILLPRFSLAALGSVMGVIEAVNDLQHDAALRVHILHSGEAAAAGERPPVASASRIQIATAASDPLQLDALFVVGDAPLPEVGYDAVVAQIANAARTGRFIVGLGTGAWLLARAGVLNSKRATIHWPYTSLFAERFPDVVVSSHIFEIDGNVATAAGGQAGHDLMLALSTRL